MLHERLKIIIEVEKNITERQTDAAKHLTLAPSTLFFMVSKKREDEEQIYKYSKEKMNQLTSTASVVGKGRQGEIVPSAGLRVVCCQASDRADIWYSC
jgi:hypothetical protein